MSVRKSQVTSASRLDDVLTVGLAAAALRERSLPVSGPAQKRNRDSWTYYGPTYWTPRHVPVTKQTIAQYGRLWGIDNLQENYDAMRELGAYDETDLNNLFTRFAALLEISLDEDFTPIYGEYGVPEYADPFGWALSRLVIAVRGAGNDDLDFLPKNEEVFYWDNKSILDKFVKYNA